MLIKEDREKFLFSLGSIALAFAVLSITIAPFIVNRFMMNTYVPIFNFKVCAGIFYFITLSCYIFSSSYSTKQINWIIVNFLYFVAFQVLAKIMA